MIKATEVQITRLNWKQFLGAVEALVQVYALGVTAAVMTQENMDDSVSRTTGTTLVLVCSRQCTAPDLRSE